ncbi:hypothetical protein SteCoe_20715 [Stentor coeruleus]|uniref:Translation initiation factor beta propellor-like domain-containing protein n=1 Tax=Stentor coeruleus TaxID=5963 RepID=A0A1R2BRB8_9CILI|nr:hypothetical protein SteCoe_20715 [Stentor coeruleus]
MNFSETLTFGGLFEFSPDSKYFAINRSSNLNIYQIKTTELVFSFPLLDIPSQILWSPNSELILAVCQKKNTLQLFSCINRDWNGRIVMSPTGISRVFWTPDSYHVGVVTDFNLRVSIWNLCDMIVYHIKNPKFEDKGLSFNSDGKFMLLAERSECKDYIGIYFTGDWSVVNHFAIDGIDIEDAFWANDTTIIIIDSCVTYQLLIYSPLGYLVARHRPYDNGLGIKSYSLSANGVFLSVGSYDQSARIFSKISWRFLTEFEHKTEGLNQNVHVYKEEEYKEGFTDEKLYSRFVVQNTPQKLPSIKVPKDKPNPPIGVGACEWSCNSAYLATRNGNFYIDNNPNVVWIWKMNDLSLSTILIETQNLKNFEWSPKSLHLVFCTGTGRMFFWGSEGASVCEVPLESKDFKVNKVKWSPDGSCIFACDKTRFMIGYPKFDILEAPNENYF